PAPLRSCGGPGHGRPQAAATSPTTRRTDSSRGRSRFMLVLSRQRDETIMIGDEIEITIVDIPGDKVRLGITAPTRIAVHRKEVYEAIKSENEQAAQFNSRIQN